MRVRRGLKRDRGLTLLELVVAVMVLAIGSIAALSAMDHARTAIAGGAERTLATLAATNRTQELRLQDTGASLAEKVTLGGRSFTLTTRTEATAGGLQRVEVRAAAQGGPGAVRVVYLAPVVP